MDLVTALSGLDLVVDPDVLGSVSYDEAEWAPVGQPVAATSTRCC
jgi:glycolate oxidase